jgi:hypothetical protein
VLAHDRDTLKYLVSRVGADRVLLGTDLPFDMALLEPIAKVREALGSARCAKWPSPEQLSGNPSLKERRHPMRLSATSTQRNHHQPVASPRRHFQATTWAAGRELGGSTRVSLAPRGALFEQERALFGEVTTCVGRVT